MLFSSTPARLALVLLALILLTAPAYADSANTEDSTIIFTAPPKGWPPFIIPDADGQDGKGIMPDILKAISDELGYSVHMEFYPEKRNHLLLSEGGIDAYPKSPKWVDDPLVYHWTDPVVQVEDVVVFRKNNPIVYREAKDLRGLQIGVIHGFIYPTLDDLFNLGIIHKHTASTTRNLLKMLDRGHVDGIVTCRQVAEWIIRQSPELKADSFGFSTATVDSAPYGFAFTKVKNWPPFIERFNTVLAAMRKDGRLQKIFDKYR